MKVLSSKGKLTSLTVTFDTAEEVELFFAWAWTTARNIPGAASIADDIRSAGLVEYASRHEGRRELELKPITYKGIDDA